MLDRITTPGFAVAAALALLAAPAAGQAPGAETQQAADTVAPGAAPAAPCFGNGFQLNRSFHVSLQRDVGAGAPPNARAVSAASMPKDSRELRELARIGTAMGRSLA